MRAIGLLVLLSLGCSSGPVPDADGFVPLFNGRDLSGWKPVNCAPETFTVRDGRIIVSGVPTGVMRTERMYENFVVELEWMHLKPRGNAGFFVHSGALPARGVPFTKGHEVQVLDGDSPEGVWTGHGDVFSIHGASFVPDRPHPKGWMRCLPSEKRANPAGQWNRYRITVNDGALKLEVNGKEVSGGTKCNPRKGYLCLESEGSECHFRNLRIRELPSTNPPAEEIAEAEQGFRSLYSGLDLRGWKVDKAGDGHWKAKDWILEYDGKPGPGSLVSERAYGECTLRFDWRSKDGIVPAIQVRGQRVELPAPAKPGDWTRVQIRVSATAIETGDQILKLAASDPKGSVSLQAWGTVQFANLFIRESD